MTTHALRGRTRYPGVIDERMMVLGQPAEVSGLRLWIDFSDASTLFTDAGTTPVSADDDLIYQANDKSGNDYHMAQATSGARPVYKTGIKNGLSIARGAGGQRLANTSAQLVNTSTGEWTVITCQKITDVTAIRAVIGQDPGAALGGGVRVSQAIRYETTGYLSSIVFRYSAAGTYIDSIDTDYSNAFVISSSVVSTSQVEMFANGVSSGSPTAIAYPLETRSSKLYIFDIGRDNFFIGDICEVLAYNVALSDTDRDSLERYLKSKWDV